MHAYQIGMPGQNYTSSHAHHSVSDSTEIDNLMNEKFYENLLLCVLYAYKYVFLCSPFLFLCV